jgi:hypothetical protein
LIDCLRACLLAFILSLSLSLSHPTIVLAA